MTSNDDLRAAGLVIYRQVNSRIEYLLLQASYANNHWSPTKGNVLFQIAFHSVCLGHVDPGESDYDAAVRETHEEAGLTYHDYDIDAIFNYNMQYLAFGRPKLVFYWLARAKDPNVKVVLVEIFYFFFLRLHYHTNIRTTSGVN